MPFQAGDLRSEGKGTPRVLRTASRDAAGEELGGPRAEPFAALAGSGGGPRTVCEAGEGDGALPEGVLGAATLGDHDHVAVRARLRPSELGVPLNGVEDGGKPVKV